MIISRTPYRISFFGGGTDYPAWYLKHGGKVLGTSINKYCYITCRELPPYFEHKHRIVYSKSETVNSLDEIQHPSVRAILKHFNIQKGLEIHYDGDVPSRSGMGSSSAFSVGLIKALHALEGRMISNREILKEALYIEQEVLKENVGSQDQSFAAYGGFNTIEFLSNGEILINPVIMKYEDLIAFQKKFMLFFTGISRFASEVAGEQIKNTQKNASELGRMMELVDEATAVLTNKRKDFRAFGKLLDETWKLKRTLSSKITNSQIDDMYNLALENGAIGGKLLGAGGGGFILFYVDPENQGNVKRALKDYLYIPFEFDFTGSEIVVYKPYTANGL